MMFYLQKFLLVLLVKFLFLSCETLKSDRFLEEKSKIQNQIAGMQLGNYIRKLMLKNNDLIDGEFVFIENSDFEMDHDELNFSNLENNNQDYDFKARLYAYKHINANRKTNKLRPYSVDVGEEDLGRNWNNYVVLLMNERGENKIVKVCFTKSIRDNFGLVMNFEKSCADKIKKIKEYKILEDEDSEFEIKSNNTVLNNSDRKNITQTIVKNKTENFTAKNKENKINSQNKINMTDFQKENGSKHNTQDDLEVHSIQNKKVNKLKKKRNFENKINSKNLKKEIYSKIIESLESHQDLDSFVDENEVNKLKKNALKTENSPKSNYTKFDEKEKILENSLDTEDLNLFSD